MHSIQSRFVIRPSNTLFGGVCVCVCTFQPGNSTGLGSEGVNGTLVPRLNSVNLGKKNVVHFPVLSSGSRHYAAIWAL